MADAGENCKPKSHEALERVHEVHRPDDWRHKAGRILESKWCEAFILFLIFCDIVLVSIEIGIDHHWLCIHGERVDVPPGKIWKMDDGEATASEHHHHLLAQSNTKPSFLARDPIQHLALDDLDRSWRGEVAVQSSGSHHGHERSLVCEDRNGHHTHHVAHTCHTWSIIILFIFLVELLTKLAINPHDFVKNRYHMLDLIVVVLSIIIDTVVTYIISSMKDPSVNNRTVKEEVEIAALLLIICRVWRVARIFHGVFEVVHKEEEEKEALEKEVEETRAENKRLQERLQALNAS